MSIRTANHGLQKRVREFLVFCQGFSWLMKSVRRWLLRLTGVELAPDCLIEADGFFASGNVVIGAGTYINRGFQTDGFGAVTIGAKVFIGPSVMVLTGKHELLDTPWQRASTCVTYLPTVIGDGVWIAARVTLLPGVTVAPGCVIGAGAVVMHDTEPNGLYAGVPARRKRDLPD